MRKFHEISLILNRDFCKAVGVANIREYEEKQLKVAKEMNEKRVRISAQESRLSTQYVFMYYFISQHQSGI